MIEFLFLDLDDTILDFHKAEAIAVAKTIRDFGVEPTPEVLAGRRRREGVLGVLLWLLSMFVLIPSVMDPKMLTVPLLLSIWGAVLACLAMWSTKRKLLAGMNLTLGAVLCLGAALAADELGPLAVPGLFCLAVGVLALAARRMRRKESAFDRQARELMRQRQTVADMERLRVEFTEEGMVLSSSTETDAQCFVYDEFLFVGETEDLLVPVCGQRAIVLQKKDLQTGSMEELRTFLREWVDYEQVPEK